MIRKWDLYTTFDAIVAYERGCDAGSHERAFVGAPGTGPAGVAWVPAGLGAVPPLVSDRTIELSGPDGSTLLFVPLAELGPVLTQAGKDRGIDPLQDPQFRVLQTLEAPAEPAVNGLFVLIHRLARAPETPGPN